MFDRLGRSWSLIKASAAVVRSNKSLLLFPVVSGIASIAILMTFLLPLAGDSDRQPILGSGEGEWVDGGRYVGAGKGDFIRVALDTLAYYEFVGTGLGDYQVTFTRVGIDGGRYSYVFSEEFDTYIYLYTGQGDYADMVRALPRINSRVVHLKASAQPVPWMEIDSEAAQSQGHCEQPGDVWTMETDRAYTLGLKAAGDLPRLGGLSLGSLSIDAGRRSVGRAVGLSPLRGPARTPRRATARVGRRGAASDRRGGAAGLAPGDDQAPCSCGLRNRPGAC